MSIQFLDLFLLNLQFMSEDIKKTQKYILSSILAVFAFAIFVPTGFIFAQKNNSMFNNLIPTDEIINEYNPRDFENKFPIIKNTLPRYTSYVTATAYNSEAGQTDDTPCHTANGFNVCEHGYENIIATNNLPLGTKVRFPDIHGNKIFYVMDRMNARYTTRVDFWMKSKSDAKKFGVKRLKMEVL